MRPGEATKPEAGLAEAAIAAVPDWNGSTIDYVDVTAPIMSPMHRNVDSLCFVVDVDRQSFFLKINHPDVTGRFALPHVFAAARMAALQGVAPRPLHCLTAQQAIVFDRLGCDWRPARVDDLRRPAVMSATIAAKTKIHAQARLGQSWSVFHGIRELSLAIAARRADDLEPVLWMIATVYDIEAALNAAGVDSAPCHGDGLASNVMIGPGDAVRLVDFDNACDMDPLCEIGMLLNEAYAFEEEMATALEMYEGHVRPQTLARCRLYAVADDLFWALWSSDMAASTSRPGVEFLKYAQWRFLRCRMALLDPGFERLLRTL